jgi:integrase
MGTRVGRTLQKLSALQVQKLKKPGHFGDGGGLWLQVSSTGTKSWVFRFMRQGKAREMGLGPVHTISLAEAREKALQCRKQLLEGLDPIEERKATRMTVAVAAAKALTFDECAERYIEAHRAGWKNVKHAAQWESTLAAYASPIFGALTVDKVDTTLVLKALEPLWKDKTETATRVRSRIENVLAWATVRGYRSGDNPARWNSHLDKLLPAPNKLAKVEHHAALPYVNVGQFMQDLRAMPGTSARAVDFIILTAARTSEGLLADWQEFDLDKAVWVIPAGRMKAGREHRVPLSREAVHLLRQMRASGEDKGFVFPGSREGRPLSNMAGLQMLKRMGRESITVHGFRSTFRDWAAEQTNFPREVAEAALAHTLQNKTEAAYQRGDLFEKRARLMQAWADYCGRVATVATVTTIGDRKQKVA